MPELCKAEHVSRRHVVVQRDLDVILEMQLVLYLVFSLVQILIKATDPKAETNYSFNDAIYFQGIINSYNCFCLGFGRKNCRN